jgi:hypothetical protein
MMDSHAVPQARSIETATKQGSWRFYTVWASFADK